MAFPIALASCFLLFGSPYLFQHALAVPLGSLSAGSGLRLISNPTEGSEALSNSLSSYPPELQKILGLQSALRYSNDTVTSPAPPDLPSTPTDQTSNQKPFTNAEFMTIVNNGIQEVTAQYPNAGLTSIHILDRTNESSFQTQTNPGLFNLFCLDLSIWENQWQVFRSGYRDPSTGEVTWNKPILHRPIGIGVPVLWPPKKLNLFEAYEAKMAANVTGAFDVMGYCWTLDISEDKYYYGTPVYEFFAGNKLLATISGYTGKLIRT